MGKLIYLPKPISFPTEMEKYCLLYKQLQASLATIWCGRLTSDKGRRLLLACNQTYLSLWHPSGTSLMKQVEKNVPQEDGARGDRSKARTSTIVVTTLWPVWHSALPATLSVIWTLGLFHLYYRCLCAAWLSQLSRPSKFRTWVQACNSSQGLRLREYKSRAYLVLPSGWP